MEDTTTSIYFRGITPKKTSIKERVDNKGLYPITCLTTLSDLDKGQLLRRGCILVKDLVNGPDFLQQIELKNEKKEEVLREAQELVNTPVARA